MSKEARVGRCSPSTAALCSRAALLAAAWTAVVSGSAMGDDFQSTNFAVRTNSPGFARAVASEAERFRKQLALEWLGRELPPWTDKCPIHVTVLPHARGGEGAGGATSFTFFNGRPRSWRMNIQGSRRRLLDSVLPHEVLHTVFATHFGQPLPRWADEGACTTVEHPEEKSKHVRMLYQFMGQQRALPFNQMFRLTEYPSDIMPLYSQGFSLARFLVAQGGKRKYVAFVGDGMRSGDWDGAVRRQYGYQNLSDLQLTWNRWFVDGADPRRIRPRDGAIVAANASDARSTARTASASQAKGLDGGWYARQADAARRRAVTQASSPSTTAVTRPQSVTPIQPLVLEAARGGYAPGSTRLR